MIDKNKILNSSGPKKISKYLSANNLNINLVVLDTTARTAVDAAKSIGVQVGAIVKSLVFNLKEDLETICDYADIEPTNVIEIKENAKHYFTNSCEERSTLLSALLDRAFTRYK